MKEPIMAKFLQNEFLQYGQDEEVGTSKRFKCNNLAVTYLRYETLTCDLSRVKREPHCALRREI